jgi:hypothetical protein
MPSSRASNPLNYNDVGTYYGGFAAAGNWRNRDGSWAWGAMTGSADTYRVRGRPVFLPGPGSERIQFWFYSRGWYIRFNPTPNQRGSTDYGRPISDDMYYYGNSTSASYPSQFSGVWSTSNVMRWFGGRRFYFFQCHNNVSGYRTVLPYYWQINSDYRLKENIKHIGKQSGHNIYTWRWKDGLNLGPTTGVIAQEVLEYMPEAVTKGDNGYYKVNYGALGL